MGWFCLIEEVSFGNFPVSVKMSGAVGLFFSIFCVCFVSVVGWIGLFWLISFEWTVEIVEVFALEFTLWEGVFVFALAIEAFIKIDPIAIEATPILNFRMLNCKIDFLKFILYFLSW